MAILGMSDDAHTRAIEEIKQLKARYFRCMDTKDWAGYLDVFTPDASIDSSEAYTPTDLTATRSRSTACRRPPPIRPGDRTISRHSSPR